MSTSFCYGCLYTARKEVQGVGLTWSAMWEESSPGDSMSLGLVFLMIAFDGCLYATIGYFIARYTNSGRKLSVELFSLSLSLSHFRAGLARTFKTFVDESIFQRFGGGVASCRLYYYNLFSSLIYFAFFFLSFVRLFVCLSARREIRSNYTIPRDYVIRTTF